MNRTYNNLIAVLVVFLILGLMLLVLGGCVSVEYKADSSGENLQVKTLFKSIDGLWAERDTEGGFSIVVDKTYTHDPMRGITDLLGTIDKLRGLGLRYDPDWRSPLMPENE